MIATVSGEELRGEIKAISSKSVVHRYLVAAALGRTPVTLTYRGGSEDIAATAGCLRALGAGIEERPLPSGQTLCRVRPIAGGSAPARPILDCGESGSTLRFLLPVAAALGIPCAFTGHGRLPERPLSPLYELLSEKGARLSAQGKMPLTLEGRLRPGEYTIAGNVSSQFVTGLLFALPLLPGESRLEVTGRLESRPYVEVTLSVLREAGIQVDVRENPLVFTIPGGQNYRLPEEVCAEGDWSNAAFWLVGAALTGEVTLCGLDLDSPQGDRAILPLLREFGAQERASGDRVTVRREERCPFTADVAMTPDLLPVLAVAAMGAEGESRITGAGRLRLKESDRLASVTAMLRALGGEVKELPDGLILRGKGSLRGGVVDAAGDHRIAMAGCIASLLCAREVKIVGAQAVDKSYPLFFRDWEALGGSAVIS